MQKIKTTGELREFIAKTIVEVRNGEIDVEQANKIQKLCAQMNESFYAEIKIAQVSTEAGREPAKLGNLPLGGSG